MRCSQLLHSAALLLLTGVPLLAEGDREKEPAKTPFVFPCSDYRKGLRGQVIGGIGKDRSEENGRYPAHLHFGLHRGPYYQLPPSFVREFREAANGEGFRLGEDLVKGELKFSYRPPTDVTIEVVQTGKKFGFSLLVGGTAPENKPEDIMCWCEGYGDEETVKEWLRPSAFLAEHLEED